MKKKYLYILILLILLSMLWLDFNKHSIYFFITFQDFSFNHLSKDIQIMSTYYIDPLPAFIFNLLLKAIGNISICYMIRKIISPLPHNRNEIIYCFIFVLFFIPIPFKGYIFILLSLFEISLSVTFTLIIFSSLPSTLLQVFCQKGYVFNDCILSLFIGAICILSFLFYYLFVEKKIMRKNL